jgi:hypothetical protein
MCLPSSRTDNFHRSNRPFMIRKKKNDFISCCKIGGTQTSLPHWAQSGVFRLVLRCITPDAFSVMANLEVCFTNNIGRIFRNS